MDVRPAIEVAAVIKDRNQVLARTSADPIAVATYTTAGTTAWRTWRANIQP